MEALPYTEVAPVYFTTTNFHLFFTYQELTRFGLTQFTSHLQQCDITATPWTFCPHYSCQNNKCHFGHFCPHYSFWTYWPLIQLIILSFYASVTSKTAEQFLPHKQQRLSGLILRCNSWWLSHCPQLYICLLLCQVRPTWYFHLRHFS